MMLVPTGCFDMGDNGEGGRQCFDAPFWIDRTEVTNAQFAILYGQAANPSTFTGPNQPRDSITWFEARDFCQSRGGRLPTEAEWEYAARGPDDLIYPWGNDFVADNVVYSSNSNNQTATVGSKPRGASWVGAWDMSGNVWEWASSAYALYPYVANDGREDVNRTDVQSRVPRGGSWNDPDTGLLRAASRFRLNPGYRSTGLGVRCARSYP